MIFRFLPRLRPSGVDRWKGHLRPNEAFPAAAGGFQNCQSIGKMVRHARSGRPFPLDQGVLGSLQVPAADSFLPRRIITRSHPGSLFWLRPACALFPAAPVGKPVLHPTRSLLPCVRSRQESLWAVQAVFVKVNDTQPVSGVHHPERDVNLELKFRGYFPDYPVCNDWYQVMRLLPVHTYRQPC